MKKLVNVYQAAKGKDQQTQQQQLHQQLTTDTSSANTSVKTQAAVSIIRVNFSVSRVGGELLSLLVVIVHWRSTCVVVIL